MKRLVYENKEAVKQHEQFENQLVNSLNTVLDRFKTNHNHFGQPIDEAFAFTLASDPLGTFDRLLRANSPIKPIGGKELDIEKLSELTGIDRKGFIQAFTITMPGSVNQYAKNGVTALFHLTPKFKPLILWSDGSFALNVKQLENDFESFRIYAETPQQIEFFAYWEQIRDTLNTHIDKKFIENYDVHGIASKTGLIVASETISTGDYKYRFELDFKKLGSEIKLLLMN